MTRRLSRSGAFLLETIVALAVFVGTGLAILGVVRQSQRSLIATIEGSRAVDLARSAAAEIDAGIESVDALDGPVEVEVIGGLADAPPADSGWELEIDTEAAGRAGLTVLTVTAFRPDDPSARHTTTRLIVAESEVADAEAEANELQELFDEAAREAGVPR